MNFEIGGQQGTPVIMVEIAMGFAVNYFFVIIWALQIEAKKAGILFSVKKDTGLDAAGVV